MNHIQFHSKLYLLVIVLMLAASGVVIAAKDTRATQLARLDELARIKDDVLPADARAAQLARLDELARIKDDMAP